MLLAPRLPRPHVPRHRLGTPELRSLTFPGEPITVMVELALGADLSAAPASWEWTDISQWVLTRERGVTITQGRRDEASLTEAGSARVLLNNTDGRFSRFNPMGAYYGQLTRSTPIRIKVNPGTGWYTRFEGFTAAWPPSWDPSETDHTVSVTCSGVLRRLGQGSAPRSAYTRYLLTRPELLEYWPCEEPARATRAGSLVGGRPMIVSGVTFGADGDLAGSGSLPTIVTGGSMLGYIRPHTSSGSWTVQVVLSIPEAPASAMHLFTVFATGTVKQWQVVLDPSTNPDSLCLYGYNAIGSLVYSASVDWSTYGEPRLLAASMSQDGPDINVILSHTGASGDTVLTDLSAVGQTFGPPVKIRVAPDVAPSGITAGQVSIWNSAMTPEGGVVGLGGWTDSLDGDAGDHAGQRIIDTATYEGIPLTLPLAPPDPASEGPAMGAQPVGTGLAVIREAEAADGGVLYEAGFGLGYRFASTLYNQDHALVLDYGQRHVRGVSPADDDQRLRNDVTASRPAGAVERIADAESTAAEGIYATPVTINLAEDGDVADQAGWRLHRGTVQGLRYPQLSLQLGTNPELIHAWASCGIGSRALVTGLPSIIVPDDVDVIIEGWTEIITQKSWDVTANVSPAVVYSVFELDHAELGRLESDGSSLTAGVDSSATSLSVATDGPIWTTTDLPFRIAVGGELMEVTAVSGAASPQTFTVTRSGNGVVKSHAAGAAVTLWTRGVLAL